MGTYKAWAAKQRGNPILLIVAALGFSSALFFGYRNLYTPWAKRSRLRQAESFASALYEKEDRDRN